MMDRYNRLRAGKIGNAIQSLIIIAGMASLFGLLGWMILGKTGLIWALVIVAVLFFSTPKISPLMVLRMYGARRLAHEEARGLYDIVERLTQKAGLPAAPSLYYVPSRVMNAFSVGTKTDSAVALSDGLFRHLNPRELTGVLAHEISHIANNDLRLYTLADVLTRITSMLSFFGQVLILFYLPMLFFSEKHIPLLFIVLLIFAPTVSMFLQMALSRTREFDADLTGAGLTGDPAGLASALNKMERYERSIWDILLLPGRKIPDPSILRTHPHTKERVDRLMSLVSDSDHPSKPEWKGHAVLDIFPEITHNPRWHWFRPWH